MLKNKKCIFCKKRKNIIVGCRYCKRPFCLSHIHDFSHNCKCKQIENKNKLEKIIPKKINKI